LFVKKFLNYGGRKLHFIITYNWKLSHVFRRLWLIVEGENISWHNTPGAFTSFSFIILRTIRFTEEIYGA
jgi:hypothetical protein